MKVPIGRIIAWLIATGFGIFGGYCFWDAHLSKQEADNAKQAEPVRMQVDFSKPGRFEGELKQTFTCSHWESLALEVNLPFTTSEEAEKAVGKVSGRISLKDSDGQAVYEGPVAIIAHNVPDKSPELYIMIPILPQGHYAICIDIQEGTPSLAGRSQTLVGRYRLCGMEYVAIAFEKGIGICCWVVMGIIVLILFMRRLRRQRHVSGQL